MKHAGHRAYKAADQRNHPGDPQVARFYSDEEMFATLSQTLAWSHFLELISYFRNSVSEISVLSMENKLSHQWRDN